MAIQDRFCANHPDRLAIGICVITHKAICEECSTRYEGVNYSREGLKILQEQRAAAGKAPSSQWILATLCICAAPVMLFLMYLVFTLSADSVMNFIFRGEQ